MLEHRETIVKQYGQPPSDNVTSRKIFLSEIDKYMIFYLYIYIYIHISECQWKRTRYKFIFYWLIVPRFLCLLLQLLIISPKLVGFTFTCKSILFPSHWTSFYVINRQLKSKDPWNLSDKGCDERFNFLFALLSKLIINSWRPVSICFARKAFPL